MKKLSVLFVASLFLTSGLIFPIKKDTKLILDQLVKLEKKITNIEQNFIFITTEFSSLLKKIKIIEDKVNAVTTGQADFNQSKENLMLSLQFIKEELNELKNNMGKINEKLVAGGPGGLLSKTANGSQVIDTPQESPETIYYTAYSDYIKKNYQLAIQGFNQFIKNFPDNALADNSLYWVGECYYSRKMYQEAVDTFTQLITRYNDGDKIPDATLKKGFALIEMGKQAQGVSILKELVSNFPLTEEASLAQQKIREVSD